MPVDRVFVFDESVGVLVGKPENIFSAVSRDDFVSVLRIEVLQFVERNSYDLLDLLQDGAFWLF